MYSALKRSGVHSCIYFDNVGKNISIDLIYCGDKKYKIQVFRRNVDSFKLQNDLLFMAEKLNLNWNGERYELNIIDEENCIEFIKKIQHFDFNF